jgi:hypothetical protein
MHSSLHSCTFGQKALGRSLAFVGSPCLSRFSFCRQLHSLVLRPASREAAPGNGCSRAMLI